MAARKRTTDEATADAIATRAATVVAEQMQGQFRAFGEAMTGLREQVARGATETEKLREQVTRGFDEVTSQMNRRFDRVEQRLERVEAVVLAHERQMRELRAAVDKKIDRDEVEGIVERAVARAVGH